MSANPNSEAGLYAFSGKATAFVGPFLVAWVTHISESQRIGMVIIPLMLMAGGALMFRVPAVHLTGND
ncbi:MAG: hypothetical protein ACLFUT_09030 [Desulfobacteraceae bacterium]